jgi:hypothetical protein
MKKEQFQRCDAIVSPFREFDGSDPCRQCEGVGDAATQSFLGPRQS